MVSTFVLCKIEGETVKVKKGQAKRVWTPEQKAEIVRKHPAEHSFVRTLEKEDQPERSMICRWVKRCISEGESSFIHIQFGAHETDDRVMRCGAKRSRVFKRKL